MKILSLILVLCLSMHQFEAVSVRVRRDAPFEMVRTNLDRAHQKLDEDEPNKYFHESSVCCIGLRDLCEPCADFRYSSMSTMTVVLQTNKSTIKISTGTFGCSFKPICLR